MYYMPAEWQPHETCLIIYPHNTGVFRSIEKSGDLKCEPARAEVRNVARSIRDYGKEDVIIFCNTQADADKLEKTLESEEKMEEALNDRDEVEAATSRKNTILVKVCPSDESWCRDIGPTFVFTELPSTTQSRRRLQQLIGLDWKFNAYGGPIHGCYWPCMLDQGLAKKVVSILNQNRDTPSQTHGNNDDEANLTIPPCEYKKSEILHASIDIILEGGSFHTDGEGTILTTEECLLNRNRNPTLTKIDIERILCTNLGATKVIWLPFGIAFDEDTNGHIDNIATFARPGEVVLSWTDDEEDGKDEDNEGGGNYRRCRAAEEALKNQVDAKGRSIKIHKLYVPSRMCYVEEEVKGILARAQDDYNTDINEKDKSFTKIRMNSQRLAGSYVNYYLANHAIILPQFGDVVYDAKALETMQNIFPDRKVIGVYSREILLGGGNIHCITQQVPLIAEVNE